MIPVRSMTAPHLNLFTTKTSWRHALCALAVAALTLTGQPAWAQSHAVVLQYHHVSHNTPASTSIPPEQFIKHLDWLADKGFSIRPLPEIVRTLRNGQGFDHDRVAALSFDDANRSLCDTAWPELQRRNLPFTVFINTEAVEQAHTFQCSWEQLAQMYQSGLMTPANHTHTHLHMISADDLNSPAWLARMRAEIERAQELIASKVGAASKLFAYPYGEYNRALAQLVHRMGYIGFGQHSGALGPHSDFTGLPRFPASGQFASLESLSTKLLSVPFPARFVPQSDNPISAHSDNNPPVLHIEADTPNTLSGINCFNAQGEPLTITRSPNRLAVQAAATLSPGRHRYTCTRASEQQGRFHWLSFQWLVE